MIVKLKTKKLSPNMIEASVPLTIWRGAPRHSGVLRSSTIWSVQMREAAYSLPYVAVSRQDCDLEYHYIGVLFRRRIITVWNLPVIRPAMMLAPTNLVIRTDFPI